MAAPALQAAEWPPLPEPAPRAVLVRGATIWTSGPKGVLDNADLLAVGGRITAVGHDLAAPAEALVVDGTGKHVTPGLIDCHSHSDIVGGVNEFTNTCTAEVRVGDVVNSRSIAMYRELAGGLTMSNLLHGSANAIGGQNAVIKLRWGQPPEKLLFRGAPPGIKFALGENPKRSNFNAGGPERYPKTRMGVEQAIRERFVAARDYMREWETYERNKSGIPPRRDLQLETIAQILRGERLVHAHSYRQDEILMLLRLAHEFGFRVGTFQHVLEGYKVADEIAAGGAGASTFSDWWAYKFEVYDAIPYNGALMHDRGVVVSFNSDSAELARRLNWEAAKAVKYGDVTPPEALKFVTLNPAIQLGIDGRVGSLEPGKDADFVIWSGDPLSTYSLCEQTWIEGRRIFDRARDLEAREAMQAERDTLVQEARAERKKAGSETKGNEWRPSYLEDSEHNESCADEAEVQP
jgi:imidazolonepropionase-like amidohydrolase